MYDAVTENGSTLLLARVLSKVSPDGKGKITYVLPPPEDELKQIPSGIEYERTSVGSAYGGDEECTSTLQIQKSRTHLQLKRQMNTSKK